MDTDSNPSVGSDQSSVDSPNTNIQPTIKPSDVSDETIVQISGNEQTDISLNASQNDVSTSAQTNTNEPSEKSGKTGIIQKWFSKQNAHYKRNRTIASISGVLLTCGIVLLVLFCIGIFSGKPAPIDIVSVEPTKIKDGIVQEDTHFIIKTQNGSKDAVRSSIYLEPAIDYEIKENIPGSEYEIVPASKLADNTLFNIDSVTDDVISYKWAFQTKNDLSVSRIYPANGANYVSENSVIEFSFSYPNITDVEKHFSISPRIDGVLDKLENSWRFTPASPLAADTTYEITITAGLSYGDEVMTKDFHSSFSTFSHAVPSSDVKSKGITLDGVSTFTENDTPIVAFTYDDRKLFNNAATVTVEQFANADDFIRHLKGEQIETTSLGDYAFEKVNDGTYKMYAILNQTLPTGYYVLHFKSDAGQNLYTADIEVNNLAAYAFESERDALVWVAENGELKSGIKVNFKGQDYETGDNGLLSLKDISDYSENLDYLKIGNNEQPLVIALKNFKNDLYPHGFIYTDRPLYMSTDTIKVWGYIPLQFFKDAPNLNNFSVVFEDIKQPIAVSNDGFFQTEIQLENYKDTSNSITVVYNDASIAQKYISVENYTLENYTYEFISDKNYVNAGENINFSIKVSHVTGFPAINKDIVVAYEGHDYYGTTNGSGEAFFSFPTAVSLSSWDNPSNAEYKYFDVRSGGAEYNKYSTGASFYVIKNSLNLRGTTDPNAKTVTFIAKSLDLTKGSAYYDLEQTDYSGAATVRFYEERHSRQITGYYYNEYTKENLPTYRIDTQSSIISEGSASFENGKLTLNYPTGFKPSEENVYYTYSAQVGTTDPEGRPAFTYKYTYQNGNFLGEPLYGGNACVYPSYLYYNPVSNEVYNFYRFGIKDTTGENPYSIGDSLRLGLYDHSNGSIENAGSVLAIEYHEDIVDYQLSKDDTVDIEFSKKIYPGAGITGAYFVDGVFHRIAPNFGDYDEQDSELSIKIETDKSSYEPGDTVKAKAIVTRADGSRANGKVNLSVVNEAVFNGARDSASILADIYTNKQFKSYSMSTYRDYELESGGGRGGTGGGRSNFGDTLFFGEKTLSNGEAEFEFNLNDSITSFRLTALAVENGDIINAGTGTAKIASYLPLSISTVIPKKVKNTDDLVLNANTIVSSGDSIDYTFTIEELESTLNASAAPGRAVTVNFGKLDKGQYTVTISAQDSTGKTDKMVYPIEVVETAQEVSIKDTVKLDGETTISPAKNPIIIELYDEITSNYVRYLEFLETHRTVRLDTLVAYYKSLDYRNKYYGEKNTNALPMLTTYLASNGTLKPLENAEGDLILTALVNYYMPDYFELDVSSYGINVGDSRDVIIGKLLVLASFKRPILLELGALSELDLTNDERLLVGLAFALAGDYDSAKNVYASVVDSDVRDDLLALLSTFIDKSKSTELIDQLINAESSAEYLPFAIISFFENNEVDVSTTSNVSVDVNSATEQITLHPLEVIRKVYNSDNLADIVIHSGNSDALATYYYQGKISELGEGYTEDIVTSLEGDLAVGQTVTLLLDITNISGESRNGEFNIALPSSLKFSGTFTGENGLYLVRNNNEYIKLSLSEQFKDNIVRIPLYVAAPGNYELESVVFKNDGGYHISNSVVFDARE